MLKRLARNLRTALDHPSRILDTSPETAGSFREKEQHELVDRPNYAYGMLRAAQRGPKQKGAAVP
jgi:hypothetical protein